MNINIVNIVQLFLVLAMGGAIGGIAGYIGSLMLTKRMSLMGGALGHLTLPGMALGLLYGFDVSLGALIFLSFGVLIIWLLEQQTQLPLEALTAVVFASSVAVAFLFLPQKEAYTALIGDIKHIPIIAITISIITSGIIFFVIKKLIPQLVLTSISPALATVEQYNVRYVTLIYLICIALVVAMGVRIVGGLMTVALVSIPASSSYNLSKNLSQYNYVSLIFGALSSIIGITLSFFVDFPAGPLIIITSALFFIYSLFHRR